MDDLFRSVNEALSDGVNDPENTTGKSLLKNVFTRLKGHLKFSLVFFFVFSVAAIAIILMIVFLVLKAL